MHECIEDRLHHPDLQSLPLRDVPLAEFRIRHQRLRERLDALVEVFREGSAWWSKVDDEDLVGTTICVVGSAGGGSGSEGGDESERRRCEKYPALAAQPHLLHAAGEMLNYLDAVGARIDAFGKRLSGLLALASMSKDELDCLQAIMHGPPLLARRNGINVERRLNLDSLLVGTASELDGFDDDETFDEGGDDNQDQKQEQDEEEDKEKERKEREEEARQSRGGMNQRGELWSKRCFTLSQAHALLADERNRLLVEGRENGMPSLLDFSREWMRVE